MSSDPHDDGYREKLRPELTERFDAEPAMVELVLHGGKSSTE